MSRLTTARQLLDQLIVLDKSVCSAQYEIGQILWAIKEGLLWDDLGYGSMAGLIEEELSFSLNTAYKWMHTFCEFKRLHYAKTEALELIAEYSFSNVAYVLPDFKQKASSRAVGKRISDRDLRTVNFTLTKVQAALLREWLIDYGAEEKNGQLRGSSEALMAILDHSVLDLAA